MTSLPRSPWLLLALGCAVGPLLTFCVNLAWYRKPGEQAAGSELSAARRTDGISVLIPARDEEAGIVAAVESVLASRDVVLEVIVLDDGSIDGTAEQVERVHARDARVSLHAAPPLPPGWNGKQHACAAAGRLARYQVLCFMDADVRLEPDALRALLWELDAGECDLVTGFPLEETGTWLEKLLIPFIHFVLLSYLPVPGLRKLPRVPSLAAGCGQLMLVRRAAYEQSGGHAAIRDTMHDGILLPRLLRQHGYATDLFDLTALARCRMYRNAGEVWRGLGKNATEGMAAPARIVPFSIMLFFGQVLPAAWFVTALVRRGEYPGGLLWSGVAMSAGYFVRLVSAWRFRQSFAGALFHPPATALLLVLQWWSLGRKLLGKQATWKQRVYRLG